MAHTAVAPGAEPAPMSLPARFVGVITSPRATFEAIVRHPAWLGMLAFVTLAMALLIGGYLSTSVGQSAWLDAAAAGVPDAQYRSMERIAQWAGYMAAGQMLIMIPLVTVITAGILYATFSALGGDAAFRQVMAVVTHASAVSVLGQLFTVPLNYARGAMSSATNLAVFFPMVDDKSFAGRLLAMTDLFIVWYLLVLAIGLGVLYRRRTRPIAFTLYGIYAVVVLVAAAVMSRLGGA